jgi:hypothetical protein
MAVNRNPKKNFTRTPNEVFEEVPLNLAGIVSYFLSKPPGWQMHIPHLMEKWKASGQSLRDGLRELRKIKILGIKKFYDTTKKKVCRIILLSYRI